MSIGRDSRPLRASALPLCLLRAARSRWTPTRRAWLSWSTALHTDEGFYTLDARHEALFGTWAPGNFHDRLLSPLLSVVQQGVFSRVRRRARAGAAGVGGVWPADGRCLLVRAAAGAMASASRSGARCCWDWPRRSRSTTGWPCRRRRRSSGSCLGYALWAKASHSQDGRRQAAFVALSGVCVAVAVMFKSLALSGGAGVCGRLVGDRDAQDGVGAGGPWSDAGAVCAALGRGRIMRELASMGAFYWHRQVEPHSWASVGWNVRRGFVDGARGLLPYLLKFLPVPCALMAWGWRRGVGREARPLMVWLGGSVAFCLLSSYAPDRYYVLFYPGLAGLAAVGAARLTRQMQMAALGLFLLSSRVLVRAGLARANLLPSRGVAVAGADIAVGQHRRGRTGAGFVPGYAFWRNTGYRGPAFAGADDGLRRTGIRR